MPIDWPELFWVFWAVCWQQLVVRMSASCGQSELADPQSSNMTMFSQRDVGWTLEERCFG